MISAGVLLKIRSPRCNVRLAIKPTPFIGICFATYGESSPSLMPECGSWSVKAGILSIASTLSGAVKMDMPLLRAKVLLVYAQ